MRKLLSVMLVFVSLGLGSLPVSSDAPLLPEGTDVIQAWEPGAFDPMTIVIDKESDVVVRKGCVVLVNGQFSSSETKALELHVGRQVVAARDYGGKYAFKWTADVRCGSYTLKVVELRRNSQRYSLWKSNIKVVDSNPLQITSPAPNSELLDPTPLNVSVTNSYKCSSLRLYVNGKAVGKAVNGELTWNVPVMPTGSYTLWLEGLSAQGMVRSDPVAVSIPTRVALAKPVADEKIMVTEESDKLTLVADIRPGIKARKVEFFCDGAKIAEASEGSKDTVWQASDVAPGQHQLSVQMTDQSGHVYKSTQVAVNLENQPYRQRQAEAAARHQAQEQKSRQEALARARDALREYWESRSKPYLDGSELALAVGSLRLEFDGYHTALGIYNGTSNDLEIKQVALIMDDYSGMKMETYDGYEDGRPKWIHWDKFLLGPQRQLSLPLRVLPFQTASANAKPKHIEVMTSQGVFKLLLP